MFDGLIFVECHIAYITVVDEDMLYLGYSRKLFFEMLNLAVSNTYFFFNKILYKQKDGLAMGNPLAPTLGW